MLQVVFFGRNIDNTFSLEGRMKVKNYLLLAVLLFSAVALPACIRDKLGYATEAKAIVNDLYLNEGLEDGYLQHFVNILYILGINYDSTSGETNPGGVKLSDDQIHFITDTLAEESTLRNIYGKTYYSLDDVAAYLDNNTAWQIEREAGSGKITADELKAVMDYYISLYENNTTVERQFFAGYLIGAISKNNPDVGTYVDEYSLDKLQLFLFLIDAFNLPEGLAFDGAALKIVKRDAGHGVSAQAVAAPSYWGSGAKKLKIKPSNTNQKVIDILEDGIKTYAYKFSLSGDPSIYCGTWQYTASAIRSCTWVETADDALAPFDCAQPAGVAGLSVNFEEYTQEHEALAPLVPPKTDSSGFADYEIFCTKQCPIGKEKSRTEGAKLVNGYVTAKFTGIDASINYPIFPATAVFKLIERTGDIIECHQN
jgi:hypothetical protein